MIVYAAIMTGLFGGVAIAFAYEAVLRRRREDELTLTRSLLEELNEEAAELRVELANLDGVKAGHTADTLYRQFLNKFDKGEQATVMLKPRRRQYYADRE